MIKGLRLKKSALLLLNLSIIPAAYCDVNQTQLPMPTSDNSYVFIPYDGRISVWGYEGSRGLGEGDAMLPLVGDSDNIFFGDVQGKYASNDSSLASPGAGFRHIINDSRILGAYVFFDHNESTNSQIFWDVSPGIESMGNVWDFRANGYIPINGERKFVASAFADEIGNVTQSQSSSSFSGHNQFNFVQFSGHNEFDAMFNIFDEVGPGADGEIGRVIPKIPNLRAFVGGYFFTPRDASNITGAEGRLEYKVNHYITLQGADTYDNLQHNSAVIGVRFTLGGVDENQTSVPIQDRILDPIPRSLSTIATGTSIPVTIGEQRIFSSSNLAGPNNTFLERSNIYFFTSNGGSAFNAANTTANCTFENPCNNPSFTSANATSISTFATDAFLYINPGTYTVGNFALPGGQSIFGRTTDFTMPASGAGRPDIVGALTLDTGSNTLDSFQLMNDGSQPIGIITTASNITLNNLQVGALNDANGYTTAISATNSSNFNITNSNIDAFSDAGGVTVSGISGANFNLNLVNSNITAEATGTPPSAPPPGATTADGISETGSTPVQISIANSTITANTSFSVTASPSAPNTTYTGVANGIISGGSANINVQNSQIMAQVANTYSFDGSTLGFGAGAVQNVTGISGANDVMVSNNSTVSAISTETGSISNHNVSGGGDPTFTGTNSAVGISSTTSDINNSSVTATATSNFTIVGSSNSDPAAATVTNIATGVETTGGEAFIANSDITANSVVTGSINLGAPGFTFKIVNQNATAILGNFTINSSDLTANATTTILNPLAADTSVTQDNAFAASGSGMVGGSQINANILVDGIETPIGQPSAVGLKGSGIIQSSGNTFNVTATCTGITCTASNTAP